MSVSERYEFRCTWCGLERVDCVCDSPRFEEHRQCGECGCWEPVDDLTPRDDPNAIAYDVCPRCL